jgi:hypothetical protein
VLYAPVLSVTRQRPGEVREVNKVIPAIAEFLPYAICEELAACEPSLVADRCLIVEGELYRWDSEGLVIGRATSASVDPPALQYQVLAYTPSAN